MIYFQIYKVKVQNTIVTHHNCPILNHFPSLQNIKSVHKNDFHLKDSSGKTPLHQLMVQQWSETETDDAVKLSIFKRLLPLINAESFVAAKKENALNRPIPRVKLLRYFEKKELFAKIFQRQVKMHIVEVAKLNSMCYHESTVLLVLNLIHSQLFITD